MKKLNKKGFTLAELLIVVAIIAVLTAIAVPLFVGALNNAEKGVKEANIRAVRGLTIGSIMSDDTNYHLNVENTTWYATAKVDKRGTVTDLTIYEVAPEGGFVGAENSKYTEAKTAATYKGEATAETSDFCVKEGDSYTVWVVITEADKVSAKKG